MQRFQARKNESLFNAIRRQFPHRISLSSIVQEDKEITEDELAFWNRQVWSELEAMKGDIEKLVTDVNNWIRQEGA